MSDKINNEFWRDYNSPNVCPCNPEDKCNSCGLCICCACDCDMSDDSIYRDFEEEHDYNDLDEA